MIIVSTLLVFISVLIFYKSMFVGFDLPKAINKETLSENKQFNKLIYVVLDGLRFDAFVPVNKKGLYFNNMTITKDQSINKQVFMSIAGIPTATTCRVIGMMTGAPSSKLDVLKAFGNRTIDIDNLVNRSIGRTRAFYGDQLWTSAFEPLRGKAKTLCSFSKDNLEDKENDIFKELMKNLSGKQDEFIFAHFISLDSFGHSLGTNHLKMKKH